MNDGATEEYRHPYFVRADMQRSVERAEQTVPEGPVGDVVRLLRARGRRVAGQARFFLIALIGTVLVALVFYLGLPQWKLYVDGRRLTLTDNRVAARAAAAELDIQRDNLKNDLEEAVVGLPVRLTGDWSANAALWGSSPAGDEAVLLLGSEGTILRYDIASGKAAPVEGTWSREETFWDAKVIGDDAVLVFGSKGTVVRYDIASGSATPVEKAWPDDANIHDAFPAGEEAVLLLGSEDTVVRYDIASGSATPVEKTWLRQGHDWSVPYISEEILLLFEIGGMLIRYDIASGTAAPVTGSWFGGGVLQGADAAGKGALLLFDIEGTVVHYDIASDTASPVEGYWSKSAVLRGIIAAGEEAVLLYGSEGTIIRYDIASGTTALLEGPWSRAAEFEGATAAGEAGVLLFGSEGTVIRYDIASGTTARVEGEWYKNAVLEGSITVGEGVLLLFGREGTVIRYNVASNRAAEVVGAWSWTADFKDASVAGEGATLLIGDEGTVVRFSDQLLKETRAFRVSADRDLLRYLDKTLPEIGNTGKLTRIRADVVDIIAKRQVVDARLAQIEGDLKDLPTGVLFQKERREQFAEFMRLCRGVEDGGEPPKPGDLPKRSGATDADPDAVTLACTQAWAVEKQQEVSSWWQTVAQQAPPAILLLFLLATFNGLYRYNMRLAGFHFARADALVLMVDQGVPLSDLTALADTLAADKVEFGKASTPSDQAVEMFRAVMGRVKPGG